jgi:hypothetical protein
MSGNIQMDSDESDTSMGRIQDLEEGGRGEGGAGRFTDWYFKDVFQFQKFHDQIQRGFANKGGPCLPV